MRQTATTGGEALGWARWALPRWPRAAVWLAVAALCALVVALAGVWTERAGLATTRERGAARLQLYGAVLAKELARYDHLPAAVQLNPTVAELLRSPGDPTLVAQVNAYLEALNAEAGASDLYLLDRSGVALAASNWNAPHSFVGVDLSYRPYFQDAMRNGTGSFYGIGTTSGEPGYYFARTIRIDGQVLGVAAVKVNLDEIGDLWAENPASAAMVVDGDGVVILTSEPGWKYRVLAPLAPATLDRYRQSRRFSNVPLTSLDWRGERELGPGEAIVSVLAPDGRGRLQALAQSQILPGAGWRILVLTRLQDLGLVTRTAQLVAGLLCGLAILTVLYQRQRAKALRLARAAKLELEGRVAERTRDLVAANDQLRHEVAERERAEKTLREAQDGLVHAGKLAVLGQMAAGLTHELNQPLAALRSLSDNALKLLDRGHLDEVRGNLGMIGGIVERMAGLTGQLKTFARRSGGGSPAARVDRCLANAVVLVDRRLREDAVTLDTGRVAAGLAVRCDPGRLEQVLVNLLGNALDALADRTEGRIEVATETLGDQVRITVADDGPGLAPEALARLFEPFFTTKEAGAGLGLGLAISDGIVREHGGSLGVRNREAGGAEFAILLPRARGDADG